MGKSVAGEVGSLFTGTPDIRKGCPRSRCVQQCQWIQMACKKRADILAHCMTVCSASVRPHPDPQYAGAPDFPHNILQAHRLLNCGGYGGSMGCRFEPLPNAKAPAPVTVALQPSQCPAACAPAAGACVCGPPVRWCGAAVPLHTETVDAVTLAVPARIANDQVPASSLV